MSLLHAIPPHHHSDGHGVRVPVVLPLVEVHVDSNGHLGITVDHEPHDPEETLTREDLCRVVTDIATEVGTPVRVEVHEADSTFIDIITPSGPMPAESTPPATTAESSGSGTGLPGMPMVVGEVAGAGFLPHEDVAVAVVVAHQVAATDGTARLRLPPALLEAHPGLVVLMGITSGAVTISGSFG